MINRLSFRPLLVCTFAAVLFFFPSISHAATGNDGTQCFTVVNNTCYDSSGGSHGTPSDSSTTPDLNNTKISGCDTSQTKIPNIGTFVARASTYVPVYDDAVTINTGYLVFKTCVLDALASQIKIASTAKITTDTVKYIAKGHTDIPTPVQSIGGGFLVPNIALYRDKKVTRNKTELYKDYNTQSINPVVRSDVIKASQIQDAAQASGYPNTYTADQQAKMKTFQAGNFNAGGGLSALWQMAMHPTDANFFAYFDWKDGTENPSNAQVAADANTQLIIDQGYDPLEGVLHLPTANSSQTQDIYVRVTPGAAIAGALAEVSGAGYLQQSNADTLDKLVPGVYSAFQERVISDNQGLSGLAQPGTGSGSNSQSFLDQMFQSILSVIQNTATQQGGGSISGTTGSSSGLTNLIAALATEQQYLSYQQQIQAYLGTQKAKLDSTQDTCWIALTGAVASIATSTPYTVATSTVYATAATANLIAPIANIIQQDIDHSTTTITALQSMIAGAGGSTSASSNQAILDQLTALSANHTLHTSSDIATAKQGVTDIQTSVGVRVDATIATWKQGIGWCNASSTTVVQSWLNAWKNH